MADKITIRRRALTLIAEGGEGVAGWLGAEFGLSRQVVSGHLQALQREGRIAAEGSTRARTYRLASLREDQRSYTRAGLHEDVVWQEVFAPVVADLPENVRDIWRYGVTEMVNNAIEHSGSARVQVSTQVLQEYCNVAIKKLKLPLQHIRAQLDLYEQFEVIQVTPCPSGKAA